MLPTVVTYTELTVTKPEVLVAKFRVEATATVPDTELTNTRSLVYVVTLRVPVKQEYVATFLVAVKQE